MTVPRRFVTIAILATAALSQPAMSGVSSSFAASSLRSMTVQRGDLTPALSRNLTSFIVDTYTNGDLANYLTEDSSPVTSATVRSHGRQGGSVSTGKRKDAHGVYEIEASVSRYRTPAGAHWEFAKTLERTATPGNSVTVTKLAVSGIGDEAKSFGTFYHASGHLYTHVTFRRGRYAADVELVSHGKIMKADTVRLARIVDARIRSGG